MTAWRVIRVLLVGVFVIAMGGCPGNADDEEGADSETEEPTDEGETDEGESDEGDDTDTTDTTDTDEAETDEGEEAEGEVIEPDPATCANGTGPCEPADQADCPVPDGPCVLPIDFVACQNDQTAGGAEALRIFVHTWNVQPNSQVIGYFDVLNAGPQGDATRTAGDYVLEDGALVWRLGVFGPDEEFPLTAITVQGDSIVINNFTATIRRIDLPCAPLPTQ